MSFTFSHSNQFPVRQNKAEQENSGNTLEDLNTNDFQYNPELLGLSNSGNDAGSKSGQKNNSDSSATTKLPDQVQAKMENSFGADFSNVNVHANSSNASKMGAKAFAEGNEVHFAPGQYNPESQSGQELLGHELTHIVQQRQGRVQATAQAKGVSINTDQSLEKEADEMGTKAAKGKMTGMSKTGNSNTNSSQQNNVVQGYDLTVINDQGTEKATAVAAMKNAYTMVNNAQINMGGDNMSRYKTWYDTNFSPANPAALQRFKSTQWRWIKLHSVFKGSKIKIDCSTRTDASFAYVYPHDGGYLVYLGSKFWSANPTGRDSQAGTLVHELSHEEAGTGDHAYGTAGAQKLAQNDPDKATFNADNWEYFGEDSF